MEKFYKIKDYDNYEISKSGILKRKKFKSPGTFTSIDYYPKAFKSKNGYLFFRLKNNNNKYKKVSQHRLMALTFIPNLENKKCVNHINGIRNDNRLENLEWVTHSENTKHGYDSNNRKNPNRKLTEKEVLEIKNQLKYYKYGMGKRLSEYYNVSTYIISLLKRNKTYKKIY
jgi:hypothetical protein